jgi:hypothetical protein
MKYKILIESNFDKNSENKTLKKITFYIEQLFSLIF